MIASKEFTIVSASLMTQFNKGLESYKTEQSMQKMIIWF